MAKGEVAPRGGEILIYQTEGGQTRIDVRLEGETLWLCQAGLAELYQTTKQNISLHIRNIYEEGDKRSESGMLFNELISQFVGVQINVVLLN